MRGLALATVIASMIATAAHAEAAHLDGVKLLRHGIFLTVRDETKPEVHTRLGFSVTVKDMKFVTDAVQVPACLGSTFGHEFQLIGAPTGALVPMQTVVIPPRPLNDPAVDQPIAKAITTFAGTIGTARVDVYKFDYDWEVLRGTWTFQVWQGDRLLLEDKFDVTGDCAGISELRLLPMTRLERTMIAGLNTRR
ncbi:DUF3859 domain-containing protein [Methylovirgula sp. 4M-Z18]|nr:DUF3859 domain-containing protein [Methylovirgula sp. 4M-Z18]